MVVRTDVGKTSSRRARPVWDGRDRLRPFRRYAPGTGRRSGTGQEPRPLFPLDLTVAGTHATGDGARLLSGPQLLADKAEYLPSDGLDVKRALLIVLEKTRDPVKLQIAQKRTFNAFGYIVGILYAVRGQDLPRLAAQCGEDIVGKKAEAFFLPFIEFPEQETEKIGFVKQ